MPFNAAPCIILTKISPPGYSWANTVLLSAQVGAEQRHMRCAPNLHVVVDYLNGPVGTPTTTVDHGGERLTTHNAVWVSMRTT